MPNHTTGNQDRLIEAASLHSGQTEDTDGADHILVLIDIIDQLDGKLTDKAEELDEARDQIKQLERDLEEAQNS